MVQLGNTPESLKAWEDGWTQLPSEDEPFEVLDEDDFFNFQFKNSLSDTLIGIANQMDARRAAAIPNPNAVIPVDDADVLAPVIEMQQTGKWPIKRNRINKFMEEPLKRLRMHNSSTAVHSITKYGLRPNGSRIRQACVMCFTPGADGIKRETTHYCAVCDVPLCVTPFSTTNSSTCFQKWHHVQDLPREQTRRTQALAESRK
eukprot:CAMPEP_0195296994 /NCGR_PEP_ID=MMETSP0707-20130614/20589_1 /TAXON_ID=33640 /ORGANISM="Asterionellopsis glacialis, Strain CCMP134" /LENGTH=202 /DNA_ID=CAMNT_0040358659 /DNA_START=59 /DNA_END=668 /DNA_ORIENTATION=-